MHYISVLALMPMALAAPALQAKRFAEPEPGVTVGAGVTISFPPLPSITLPGKPGSLPSDFPLPGFSLPAFSIPGFTIVIPGNGPTITLPGFPLPTLSFPGFPPFTIPGFPPYTQPTVSRPASPTVGPTSPSGSLPTITPTPHSSFTPSTPVIPTPTSSSVVSPVTSTALKTTTVTITESRVSTTTSTLLGTTTVFVTKPTAPATSCVASTVTITGSAASTSSPTGVSGASCLKTIPDSILSVIESVLKDLGKPGSINELESELENLAKIFLQYCPSSIDASKSFPSFLKPATVTGSAAAGAGLQVRPHH